MSHTESTLQIRLADWSDPDDAAVLLRLLDAYAQHPMGGLQPLRAEVRAVLPTRYAAVPGAFSLLALQGNEPLGMANCLTSFSTFHAAPRVNIHDLFVCDTMRGRGLGRRLLAAVCQQAALRGAAAVTLEVRADNQAACHLYKSFGFQGIGPPAASLPSRGQPVYYFAMLPLPAPRR